jgi:A/G-specific adenine glycosylase
MSKVHPFSLSILNWYAKNARDLPWRNTNDPYLIWLSEIILQQTRVQQGMPYFFAFKEQFPTVMDLAKASEETVLRTWQGLGYYSRARNLHKTAKHIAFELNGTFPNNYDDLLKLPGIGPYSAAAISSFAYNEHQAVVDGNVFRILSRYFGIFQDIADAKSRKVFTDLANDLMPAGRAAMFNQAIMEFGSLQCSPQPLCESCPLQSSCYAFAEKKTKELPVKSKKQKITTRYFQYFVIEKNKTFLVQKRQNKDIWQGLYEFYLVEDKEFKTLEEILENDKILQILPGIWRALVPPKVHQLSHQKIHCQAWHIQIPDNFTFESLGDFSWKSPTEFEKLGKSVLISNLLIDNNL